MTAFQILEMKHFMAKLLTEDCFDSFLLEKASVSCAVSYEIDGRVNPEFYQDDETPDAGYLFLPWKSIRPVLFQMIRGKHTPLSFKFVLHLMPQYVPLRVQCFIEDKGRKGGSGRQADGGAVIFYGQDQRLNLFRF